MTSPLLPLTRPLSAAETLDTVFRLFRQTLVPCLVLALAGVVVGQLPYVVDLARGTLQATMTEKGPLWWFVMLASSLASLLLFYSLSRRQLMLARGARTTLGDDLRAAVSLLPRAIGVAIVALVQLGIVGLGTVALWKASSGLLAALAAGLGIALAAWLIVPMALAAPVLVTESASMESTVRRAFDLVRGQWWRAALVLAVGLIVIMVFYSVGGLIGLLVAQLVGGLDLDIVTVVTTVLMALLGCLFAPLYSALTLVLMHELRLRRDGGDLDARIGALAR